ncbi:hypothetical protein D9619_009805 [Psilocybe cf. subviscida]|uniref:Uncharacterized protein n=1 Tax=Psilocybe cf. subviscida TaxID=2480587 RepID=A0A8H5BLG8_9AGAR|nr:hypothetical protein D9619_009805 [Psilocybe cf. subviscida]
MAESITTETRSTEEMLTAYGSYPFDTDEAYQQGLASILSGPSWGPNASQDAQEEIIRRTRVFYFNRVLGGSITIEQAREYEASLKSDPASAATNENRVLSFAELKELIETGNVDKIPNNKVIPEGLNDAPPSQSTAPARKKPWETVETHEST